MYLPKFEIVNCLMGYNKIFLYYFSGTGNSRAAANWFQEVASERQIPCKLIQLYRDKVDELPDQNIENQLIGFFFPTHGFNAAPAMLSFIWKFPQIKNTSVFIVNTRAGMKISKLFLPGLSGLAQLLPAILLKFKGFRVVGMQPLDLPSNWISLHPGIKETVVQSMFEHYKVILKSFASRILEGKSKYKALISLPIDLFVVPISFGYYFFGRFFLAKMFISTSSCDACGICENQCPVGAIKLKSDRPFWKYTCESCMKCMNNCPKKAIQTAHLYSFIWWILLWILLPTMGIWIAFENELFRLINNDFLTENILTIALFTISLPIIALAYRFLHFATQWKWMDVLNKYTSLTSFKFWRRYSFGLKRFRKVNHH